ncbi:hypothetical protein [Chryseobacterium sp. CT-SW4]|uniref:hypothetical protein n=1 Tax=Chryseobacterium sp. SW-1 TaxID=3157343 RepID=UPI003B0283E9
MFIIYKEKVVEAYRWKKDKGLLSLNLSAPTPSKLKKESQIVYSERYMEKDTGTLRLFFPVKEGVSDYSISIRNLDTDKFKPLSNFLKGLTSETEDKNIELLAWLIDFDNRPYNAQVSYSEIIFEEEKETGEDEKLPGQNEDVSQSDSENSDDSNEEEKTETIDNEVNTGEKEEKKLRSRWREVVIGSVSAASIFLAGYTVWDNKQLVGDKIVMKGKDSSQIQGEIILTPTAKDIVQESHEESQIKSTKNVADSSFNKEIKCMYWNEDHYQEVSCDDKNIAGTPVALDRDMLIKFRKITFPDTLTERSIDKVWYLKSDNKLEFFTSSGYHPTKKAKLKKLSKYILDKYIKEN